jgi:hypothetical protein
VVRATKCRKSRALLLSQNATGKEPAGGYVDERWD